MDPQDSQATDRLTRVVVALDVLLGTVLFVLAAYFLVAGFQMQADPNAPHGGAFAFLGTGVAGPIALLFGLAAVAVGRRWRLRWAVQALTSTPASASRSSLGAR